MNWLSTETKPHKRLAGYIRESSNHSLTFTKAKNKWNNYAFSVSWFCIYVISTTIYYNLLIFIVHLVLCLKGLLWKQSFNILLKEAGSKKDFLSKLNVKNREKMFCLNWQKQHFLLQKRLSSFCMWKNESFNCLLDNIDNVSKNIIKEALYHHTLHYDACSKGRLPIVEYLIETESYIKEKAQC